MPKNIPMHKGGRRYGHIKTKQGIDELSNRRVNDLAMS